VEPQACARTPRQRAGDHAEAQVAKHLDGLGWRVIGRNVRVGRHEIDLVAIEPGVPPTLVFVEVRSRSTTGFGPPEESVVGGKATRMYRAAIELVHTGRLPDGSPLPRLPWRVDLVSVVREGTSTTVRHLRGVDPG
jgi:putative endonuclease